MAKRYKKGPVVIEAVQYDGLNEAEIISFANGKDISFRCDGYLFIRTNEGITEAGVGDFIIKGVEGELFPCKPDIFERTYKPIE